MADFTLGTSTLQGGQYVTRAFNMNGEFRELQLRFFNAAASQDFEVHFVELHLTLGGVSMEER